MLLRSMTKLQPSSLKVVHDIAGKEFTIRLEGSSEKAYLSYEHVGTKVVDLQHTVVPDLFRGQGVGKILAKAAFDFVSKENLSMKLSCWYLQKYIDDNPTSEYCKLVAL